MFDYTGKTALIIGASSGLGESIERKKSMQTASNIERCTPELSN